MEWKQPEGLRRHWVLEELDAELLFLSMPVNAAQGRVGDDVYDLRDGGTLRKKRTLLVDKAVVATLEEKAAGAGGTLCYGDRQYEWKPESHFGTRWVLKDSEGNAMFTYAAKQGLAKVATVQMSEDAGADVGPLLILCWYVTVL